MVSYTYMASQTLILWHSGVLKWMEKNIFYKLSEHLSTYYKSWSEHQQENLIFGDQQTIV